MYGALWDGGIGEQRAPPNPLPPSLLGCVSCTTYAMGAVQDKTDDVYSLNLKSSPCS